MREPAPVLVGIDAGLTNVTVAAFDAEGSELASATRSTPTLETPSGRDEQDHDRLWETVRGALGDTLAHDAVDADAVAGVGVAGHGHGLYALDDTGEPVCGIKSTDSRAIGTLEEFHRDSTDEVEARLGWKPFGADPLSLLVWLREHDPESYGRIETLLFSKDVLTHRLTGEHSTDPSEGSVFYGPEEAYDESILSTLGLSEVFSALPSVVSSTEACGTVTKSAEIETGLPEGTPVATGLQDVAACALGSGVVSPETGLIVLGTWGQSVAVLDSPPAGTGGGLPRRYLDGWLRYEGIRSGAACVEWFVENCGGEWRREADERGISPYVVYEEVLEGVPPGSEGLVFHPYLTGSTDDPDSAGGFYGLRLEHTNAHMLRSIHEGVAISQTDALESIAGDFSEVRLTGGGARSDAWAEAFADLSGRSVTVPSERETGALGAAICGGVAAGVYPDPETAAERAVGTDRRFEPDPGAEERYRAVRTAFFEALEGMARPWETLNSALGDGEDG